jgi:hypothetical protein
LSLRNPGGAFHLMQLIAAATATLALLRRQLGAAGLLSGAAVLAFRHIRFEALFASLVAVVAGSVLTSALAALPEKIKHAKLSSIPCSVGLAIGIGFLAAALAGLRSIDLVTDRGYLASTDLGTFGTGLSWWFPERAAAFVERENLPGQIFNSYNEGGYLTWRLGPKYPDYVDGRALPFGAKLVDRNTGLLATPPGSPEWQQEAAAYDINTILVPLGRYNGLQLFPVLRQFCASPTWRPVYLDEVSAVFLRVRPENEGLIDRLQIQCATAPLPAVPSQRSTTEAFNQWANAAAVLQALGRNGEAFEATNRALSIFADNAFVHFLRGNLLEEARDPSRAEQEYRMSAALEPNGTTWSRLAVHLQLDADVPLLVETAGVQPRGTQGFDARTRRPAIPGGQHIRAYPNVSIRVGVGDRPVEQPEESVPAPLIRRPLILPLAHRGAQLHLVQIDIHAGAAQLVGPREPKRKDRLDIGWGDDNDRFAVITGTGQRLPDRRVIARPPQDFDPGIVGKRRPGGEQADAVVPKSPIGTGDRSHCLGLIDRAEQCPSHCYIIKGRMQMVEAQAAHRGVKLGNDSDIAIPGKLLQQIARRQFPPIDLTAGSPKASIRPISKRQRRCSTRSMRSRQRT